MIVKNESHILRQTLTQLLHVFPITYWVIDDTGSTDGTQDIIRTFFAEKGISGELYETSWQDFGWNRTQAFQHAYNKTDYVLVWDADDSVVGSLILPEPLVADAYKLTFGEADGFRYKRLQIFNNRRKWRYVGVLHEYPTLAEGESPLTKESDIDGNYYCISGRTGARNRDPDKYKKDAAILEHALLLEPKNTRYMFYCANSYMNAGDPDNAIRWFKKCIDAGGWIQERYMSAYEAGCQYNKKGDVANAIYYWLEAHKHDPTRGEALYEIVKHYRITANWSAAKLFYERLAHLTPPKEALFSKNAVYGYLRDYEYSIMAFYTKDPIDHRSYLNLIGSGYNTQSVLSNYKFYARKLKDLPGSCDMDFSDTVEKVVAGRGMDTFRSSSPCIIPHPSGLGGYIMNVRYVNYKISPQGGYEFRHSDGKITTLNRLLWLDCDLKPTAEHWFDNVANPHLRYQGVEDVRIFTSTHGGPVRFIGTVEHPTKGLISVGTGDYNMASNQLTPTAYESPLGRTCEKNWVPAGGNRLIYDWSPLTVMDASTGAIVSRDPAVPAFFSLLRGSTGGTPVGDELWFVCHFVEYSTPRHYYHLIVVLDRETLRYRRHSTPFKFHGDPIEYCLGLVVESTRILMSYSRWDRTSAVLSVPREGFEKIYFETELRTPHFVVNLERRPDRRDSACKALEAGGVRDVRFLNAVDGKTLTATKEITDIFRNNRFGNRRGIIGCAMSHYRLWQQLVSDPASDYFIVLEDDITVVDTFASAVEDTVQRCRQENIDLLFIGFHTKKKDYTFQQSLQVAPQFVPFVGDDYVGGTFGYILSKKGAHTYLDYVRQNGMSYAVDMIVYGLQGRMNIQFCSPPLVSSSYVSEAGSTVDSDIQRDTDILEFL